MPEAEWGKAAVADLMWIVAWVSVDGHAAAIASMEDVEAKSRQLPAHP